MTLVFVTCVRRELIFVSPIHLPCVSGRVALYLSGVLALFVVCRRPHQQHPGKLALETNSGTRPGDNGEIMCLRLLGVLISHCDYVQMDTQILVGVLCCVLLCVCIGKTTRRLWCTILVVH